ncbi:hypothetical protein D0Y65_034393 [Glycine soja]|uniref:Putative plant transposon protein domain-containing protein n=1 Tax=Glycine soja TaxID=3848 RepID=A0A445HQG4_GLYSO|nr:hypothetical protein D0Y65_034393 [Glycine soja]
MQNQELHFGKSYLIENYHGEPELQSYNQNEAEGRPNLDKLLMQFKETTESTQQAIANAEIQVGKLAEEMTQFVARREEDFVEVAAQEESHAKEHDSKEKDEEKGEEKAHQVEEYLQVDIQPESILQVKTFPHQLIVKEERHGEHDNSLSIILSLINDTSSTMIWKCLNFPAFLEPLLLFALIFHNPIRLELEFYFGYNVLALIRVRWPNKGLSEGVRNPCFSGNCDERAKRGCVLNNVLGRKILPERNEKLFITEFDEFRRELERRNLHKELTNFSEGSIDVAIMKELYANLYDPEDKSPKQVWVRGHLIKFDADSLNTFLHTLVILEQVESLPAYSRFCRLRLDPQELIARLCIPGRGFELNADGLPLKILRKNLTTMAQTWSVLSFSNLALTSHTSDITLDRARLIYELIMKMDMNLGSLISGQISLIAQHDSSRLGFPALITALCKARGVTSDSLTFESLSPAINLTYIKKNCWNLDDPSVIFPGTHKSRARGSKALSISSPPGTTAPSTSAPATSILPSPLIAPVPLASSTPSSDPIMTMLKSLHQGQLLIMQSLQDVA